MGCDGLPDAGGKSERAHALAEAWVAKKGVSKEGGGGLYRQKRACTTSECRSMVTMQHGMALHCK